NTVRRNTKAIKRRLMGGLVCDSATHHCCLVQFVHVEGCICAGHAFTALERPSKSCNHRRIRLVSTELLQVLFDCTQSSLGDCDWPVGKTTKSFAPLSAFK